MDVRARYETTRERWLPSLLALQRRVVGQHTPAGSTLDEMLAYHLDTGGKRLRALIPLMVAEALHQDAEPLVPFGAACEMLHNATLVHDDLQDGDTLRRGQATVWYRFGQPQAINLGDAMFYYAVLLLQELEHPVEVRERLTRRLLRETLRVIDGQEREFLLQKTGTVTEDRYFAMVSGKTSGLFSLPMAGAAELCRLPAPQVAHLEEAASHLGVLFQVQDDILDLYGDKGRGGAGNDIAEGKRSLPVVLALRHLDDAARARLETVLQAPRDETTPPDIAWALGLIRDCGALDASLAEIRRRRGAALEAAGALPHEPLHALVGGLCDLFLEPISDVVV